MLEGRSLVEHYVSRAADDTNQIDGNVYRGRVQNVLQAWKPPLLTLASRKTPCSTGATCAMDRDDIEAARPDRRAPSRGLEDVLKAGQTILCQVTKNPSVPKGPD